MKRTYLLFALIVFLPLVTFAQSVPAFPMAFWGSITINGVDAPADTIIEAYYGNELAGQVMVKEQGIYGYSESTKQKLLIREGVGTITFKVRGIPNLSEENYPSFEAGETKNKNLAFLTINQNNASVPQNSGGGGGGGGSVTTVQTAQQNTTTQKIDSNNDGKTDVLDFNTLMINWGKIGTNNIADFNNDGKVDVFDFNLLMINWTI